jgi:hypothetical protein
MCTKEGVKGATPGRVLSPRFAGAGYLYVTIGAGKGGQCRNIAVHTMVALAFIGPCQSGMTVNHKNGVKTDNFPGNLQYCTQQDNIAHSVATGLAPRGTRKVNSKLTDGEVRKMLAIGRSRPQSSIAKEFGVTQSVVSKILRRESWAHVI